jgi:hypothetical protein
MNFCMSIEIFEKAALETHALQTLARDLKAHGNREASGVRASLAPLCLQKSNRHTGNRTSE